LQRVNLVQVQIELQDVYAGLAEETELALAGMKAYERSQVVLTHLAFFGHARNLELRRGRRDVRIQS